MSPPGDSGAGSTTSPPTCPCARRLAPRLPSTPPCRTSCLPGGGSPRLEGCSGDGLLPRRAPPFPSSRYFSPQSFGFALLARSSYHWQLSFLQAEQVLLDQLDEDGGCRRKCFQAVRQMQEDVWCPGKRPVISSHHLQVSVRPPAVEGPGQLWSGVPSPSPVGLAGAAQSGEGCMCDECRLGAPCPCLPPTHHCSLWRRTDPGCACVLSTWPR